MEGRFTYGCWASFLVLAQSKRIMIVTGISVPVSVPETSVLAALSAGTRGDIPCQFICSMVEAAGRPACTSPSVLLLRGWLCGVARDGQVEQDHGVVVGGAGLG
jgi:hypothetical protein